MWKAIILKIKFVLYNIKLVELFYSYKVNIQFSHLVAERRKIIFF